MTTSPKNETMIIAWKTRCMSWKRSRYGPSPRSEADRIRLHAPGIPCVSPRMRPTVRRVNHSPVCTPKNSHTLPSSVHMSVRAHHSMG